MPTLGVSATMPNLISLMGSLYPLFITCFLLLSSVFNQSLAGFAYIGGLALLWLICWMIAKLGLNSEKISEANKACYIFTGMSYPYLSPSYSSALSWFTFIYLLLPTIPPVRSNTSLMNPMIIILTAIFASITMLWQINNGCSSKIGVFLGMIIGLTIGAAQFFALYNSNNKNLLFYNDLVSNNVVCNRPAKQTFRCQVYKGGELISNTVV